MFAPDHAATAREIARVTRRGGRIALANWTPTGGLARMFKVMAPFQPAPPPSSPFDWGAETRVHELLGESFELELEERVSTLRVAVGRGVLGAVLDQLRADQDARRVAGERREECGLPGGVLNVITSKKSGDVSEPIIGDSRLRKLSFTGSTEVGRKLIAQAADNVLKVSMELGGNAPFLVFGDADLDDAIEGAMIAKMRNIGEACTSANRFHVHESLADEFAEKLAKKMGAMKIGRGSEEETEVGPLIDADQRDKVAELVEDAVEKGATCVTGGSKRDGEGYFFEPTVLSGIPDDARVLSEEIFGPVAPIATFSSDEEAIEAANKTEYGLVSYVYTSDLKRALRVCEALETGMIGLNQGMVSNAGAPFGGVKQSGVGREGGNEGIHEYLETKYIAVNL